MTADVAWLYPSIPLKFCLKHLFNKRNGEKISTKSLAIIVEF